MFKFTKYLLLFLPFVSFTLSPSAMMTAPQEQQRRKKKKKKRPQRLVDHDESHIVYTDEEQEEKRQEELEHSSDEDMFDEAFAKAGYGMLSPDTLRHLRHLFSNNLRKRRMAFNQNWERIRDGAIEGMIAKAFEDEYDESVTEKDRPLLIKMTKHYVKSNRKVIQKAIVANERVDIEKLDDVVEIAVGMISTEQLTGFLNQYKKFYQEVTTEQQNDELIGWRRFFNTGIENKCSKGIEQEVMRRIKMDKLSSFKKGISHVIGVGESLLITPFHRLHRVQKERDFRQKRKLREGEHALPLPMPLKDAYLDFDLERIMRKWKLAAVTFTLAWLGAQIASSLGISKLAHLLMVSAAVGAAAAVAGGAGYGVYSLLTRFGIAPELATAGGIITAILVAIAIYVTYRKYQARAKKREKQVPYIVSNWAKSMQQKGNMDKAIDGIKNHKGKLSAVAIVAILAVSCLCSDSSDSPKKKVMTQDMQDLAAQAPFHEQHESNQEQEEEQHEAILARELAALNAEQCEDEVMTRQPELQEHEVV